MSIWAWFRSQRHSTTGGVVPFPSQERRPRLLSWSHSPRYHSDDKAHPSKAPTVYSMRICQLAKHARNGRPLRPRLGTKWRPGLRLSVYPLRATSIPTRRRIIPIEETGSRRQLVACVDCARLNVTSCLTLALNTPTDGVKHAHSQAWTVVGMRLMGGSGVKFTPAVVPEAVHGQDLRRLSCLLKMLGINRRRQAKRPCQLARTRLRRQHPEKLRTKGAIGL